MIRRNKADLKAAMREKYGEPGTLDELFLMIRLTVSERVQKTRNTVVGFNWNINYRNKVSCSHCSPVGELNNWGIKADRPRSFPGFIGRVWIRTAKPIRSGTWMSNMFDTSLSYTGTGGGGSYNGKWADISKARYLKYESGKRNKSEVVYPKVQCWSWDYKIFCSDFPAIIDEHTKSLLFDTIKNGNKKIVLNSTKLWEDAATAHADEMFLAECKREDVKDLELFA